MKIRDQWAWQEFSLLAECIYIYIYTLQEVLKDGGLQRMDVLLSGLVEMRMYFK